MADGTFGRTAAMLANRFLAIGGAMSLIAMQLAPLPLPALAPVNTAFGLAPAAAQYGGRSVRVTCYARGDRPNSCALPRGTQSVRLIGSDSGDRCREGDTWRRRGNEIWVTGGCGGTFEAVVQQNNSGGGWGGSGGYNSGGGWGGSNSNTGFAGEVTCRSRENRQQRCYANTAGRLQLLQQYSRARCIEGNTWRHDRYGVTVRNGCQARFGYGYGSLGGDDSDNWGGGGSDNWGGGWGGGNQGFAGQIECRSQDNRYRRCSAYTNNRVELLRQFSSTNCTRGRNWGYDQNSIWVDNGCQARFGYGTGNARGHTSDSGGSNTGAVIGGVALAAGLVALLAAANKGSSRSAGNTTSATAPARIAADQTLFPSEARTAGSACLAEAARQVGATGGTRVRLDGVDRAQRSGDGWMILAPLTASYPDHSQKMAMDCRTTGNTVSAFDVR